MRDECNISKLNSRKNPYVGWLKKRITSIIDGSTSDYFKSLADAKGTPYQTLTRLRRESAAAPDILAVSIYRSVVL